MQPESRRVVSEARRVLKECLKRNGAQRTDSLKNEEILELLEDFEITPTPEEAAAMKILQKHAHLSVKL